jgi:hypothetical protein
VIQQPHGLAGPARLAVARCAGIKQAAVGRVKAELDRLRAILREHGIDSGAGAAERAGWPRHSVTAGRR